MTRFELGQKNSIEKGEHQTKKERKVEKWSKGKEKNGKVRREELRG